MRPAAIPSSKGICYFKVPDSNVKTLELGLEYHPKELCLQRIRVLVYRKFYIISGVLSLYQKSRSAKAGIEWLFSTFLRNTLFGKAKWVSFGNRYEYQYLNVYVIGILILSRLSLLHTGTCVRPRSQPYGPRLWRWVGYAWKLLCVIVSAWVFEYILVTASHTSI